MNEIILPIDGEMWVSIFGYPKYYISNKGRIKVYPEKANQHTWKNLSDGMLLKTVLKNSGYLKADIYDGSKKKTFMIHRLVAIHFNPNPGNLPEVNHNDGDKLNNISDNLSWSSSSNNMIHAYKNRLANREGTRNCSAKLTEGDVIQIRALYKSGNHSVTQLAKAYGISGETARQVVNRKSWVHI